MNMTTEKTWDEFRESGLFCWINRTLHLFGWVLVVEADEEGAVTRCYPAHCRFRGFTREVEDQMFKKVTKHLRENLPRLEADLPLSDDDGG